MTIQWKSPTGLARTLAEAGARVDGPPSSKRAPSSPPIADDVDDAIAAETRVVDLELFANAHSPLRIASDHDRPLGAGSRLSIRIPALRAWYTLPPIAGVSADRLRQLKFTGDLLMTNGGTLVSKRSFIADRFEGSGLLSLAATAADIVLARRIDAIRCRISIEDTSARSRFVALESESLAVVLGSNTIRTLRFDSEGSRARCHVVEGGRPLAGRRVRLSYAAARADRFVASRAAHAMGTGGVSGSPVSISAHVAFEPLGPQSTIVLRASDDAPDDNRNGHGAYEAELEVPLGASRLDVSFSLAAANAANAANVTDSTRQYIDDAGGRAYRIAIERH